MESIMNRPIKFRIWDKYQNKFLPSYGDLGILFYHEQGESWHSKGIRDVVPVSWFLIAHNNNLGNYIVQQYTGLKDSKDNEIYEGDILIHKTSSIFATGVIGQVLYEADHGGYIFQYKRNGPNQNYMNLNCDVAFESVIVGNIFETPYLLK